MRQTIRAVLSAAASFEDFSALLSRVGVSVKESRGRLSYLTPDRTKPITARKLGDDFDRATVLATLAQNAARAAEQTERSPGSIKSPLQAQEAPKNTPEQDSVHGLLTFKRSCPRARGGAMNSGRKSTT